MFLLGFFLWLSWGVEFAMAFWVVWGVSIGVSDGLGFGWLIVPWCSAGVSIGLILLRAPLATIHDSKSSMKPQFE